MHATMPSSESKQQVEEVCRAVGGLFDAGEKQRAIELVEAALSALVRENRSLGARLGEALRKLYGRSSEKVDPNQLRLVLDELHADQQAQMDQARQSDDPVVEDVPMPPRRRRDAKRRKRGFPKELPREEIRLLPTPEQLEGKGEARKIGEERSEVLEYVPAQFKVLVYVREKWATETEEIVTAPVGMKIIEKGIAGPGLLTYMTVSKYRDHIPLGRMSGMLKRLGVFVSKNTMVDWVACVAFLLTALALLIWERALLAYVMQVDDTHLRVLDPAHPKNVKRGHFWCMVGDGRYIAFRYTEDWTAERAAEFLGERVGWMQIDGYGGYEPIIKASGSKILPVGCWMHGRRGFVKAFDAGELAAAVPVDIIKRMYKVEEASKKAEETHGERYERRQRELVPLLDELEDWLKEHTSVFEPKSKLGEAISYANNHWEILRVVEKDGALELDNGEPERRLRHPAIGRKNWQHAGSDNGAERAAIIMTVLETAATHGLNVEAYLYDVLVRLATGHPKSRLEELLPENWQPVYAFGELPETKAVRTTSGPDPPGDTAT